MQFLITNPTKKKRTSKTGNGIWLVLMEDDSLILFSLQVMQKLEIHFPQEKKYFKGMINIKLNQLKTIF